MLKLPEKVDLPNVRMQRRPVTNRRPLPPGTLDYRAYLKRHAKPGDWTHVVDKPCILGNPMNPDVVYVHLKDYGIDLSPLVKVLPGIKFPSETSADRTDGMVSISRVFGFEPRRVIRKDFCGPTGLANEDAAAHDLLVTAAGVCDHFYRLTNPNRYHKHRSIANENETIKEWLLMDDAGKRTVFTSGILNWNNQLPYHYDRGNVEDVWSAMLVFRSPDMEGGWLSVPEYDAAFTLPDHSLFMFDGQNLLHGVTPFTGPETAYRYSAVYYSLKGMWSCMAPGPAELERFRDKATRQARERSKADIGTLPQSVYASLPAAEKAQWVKISDDPVMYGPKDATEESDD